MYGTYGTYRTYMSYGLYRSYWEKPIGRSFPSYAVKLSMASPARPREPSIRR